MEIVITAPHIHITDAQAISLEEVMKRKAMRRRRVAKRMLKKWPLFAVEEMQPEFPGYTQDEFIADVTRKTRKGKSFRRPKAKAFDWRTIRKEIPEFFNVCVKRTPTQAVLHGRLNTGEKFTCIVRSFWMAEYGQKRMETWELIRLWRGPIKQFCAHPAMIIQEHRNEIIPPNPKS